MESMLFFQHVSSLTASGINVALCSRACDRLIGTALPRCSTFDWVASSCYASVASSISERLTAATFTANHHWLCFWSCGNLTDESGYAVFVNRSAFLAGLRTVGSITVGQEGDVATQPSLSRNRRK